MDDQHLYNLIDKSLSGGMTDEEQTEFENSLVKNPNHLNTYKELQQQWLVGGRLKLDLNINTEESWKKFTSLREGRSVKGKYSWTAILKVAAMILVTIGIGFYFANETLNESIQYTTGDKQVLEVVLPDSSRIWLNESSVLTLANDFNELERNVTLEGEAFFDIERNESKAFIITSGKVVTEVLGTSFNIDSRQQDDEVSISVVSGRVSFTHNEKELILTKGEAAVFNKTQLLLSQIESSQNSLSWHSKKLVFQDQTLANVIVVLEEYFKIDINLTTNSASTCLFTGEFEDPKLEEVLEVIALTLNLTIEHNNKSYTISGAGCTNK